MEFHDALFANQPEAGGAGLSDEEMIEMAAEVGASEDAIRGPIERLKSEPWIEDATEEWSKRGFTGTRRPRSTAARSSSPTPQDLLANTEKAIADALGE